MHAYNARLLMISNVHTAVAHPSYLANMGNKTGAKKAQDT